MSAGSSGLHSAFAFFVPQGPQQNLKRENELACVCANQGLSVYKQRTGRGLAGGHLPVAIGKRIRDTLVPCAASRAARRSTYTAVVWLRIKLSVSDDAMVAAVVLLTPRHSGSIPEVVVFKKCHV